MTEHTEFGGVHLVIDPGWYDITDDLDAGSPPTLARKDGIGVLQFSSATHKQGPIPTVGAKDLTEMLLEFARAQGLPRARNVRAETAEMLIVSGDFVSESEAIRAWYITDTKNVAFVTYTSQSPDDAKMREELQAADAMVRSIRT